MKDSAVEAGASGSGADRGGSGPRSLERSTNRSMARVVGCLGSRVPARFPSLGPRKTRRQFATAISNDAYYPGGPFLKRPGIPHVGFHIPSFDHRLLIVCRITIAW